MTASLDIALFGERGALTLDLHMRAEGGLTALFGPSGSGKTTALQMIAGLIRPRSGHIRIGGRSLYDSAAGIDLPPERRRIGYVFQEDRLFPHLSVAGNLAYGAGAATGERMAERAALIDLLDLHPLLERRPRSLSGGEKRRVAIGRALLTRPALLLMDEPLTALDAPRKGEILTYIERLRDETRLPILYVSHAIEEIARLAQRVFYIRAGRIVTMGSAEAVFADPALIDGAAPGELGAIVKGRLIAHEAADGISLVATPIGELSVPRIAASPGSAVALQIKARDIMLSLTRPQAISALNILACRILSIQPTATGQRAVALDCRGQNLLAIVTGRSARLLDLAPGREIFAIVKSVALDR